MSADEPEFQVNLPPGKFQARVGDGHVTTGITLRGYNRFYDGWIRGVFSLGLPPQGKLSDLDWEEMCLGHSTAVESRTDLEWETRAGGSVWRDRLLRTVDAEIRAGHVIVEVDGKPVPR